MLTNVAENMAPRAHKMAMNVVCFRRNLGLNNNMFLQVDNKDIQRQLSNTLHSQEILVHIL